MATRRRRRTDCATCGHDVTLHQYEPDAEPAYPGPGKCRGLGGPRAHASYRCACKRYVQPRKGQRRVSSRFFVGDRRRSRYGNARPYREITFQDVGKRTFTAFGRRWRVEEFIGEIHGRDVGKRVYLVGDIVQVENEGQRASRLARSRGDRRRYGNRVEITLKNAQARMRALGLVLTKADGEYRVNFRGGREGTAYYTNDIRDAVMTGESMAQSRVTHGNARFGTPMYRPRQVARIIVGIEEKGHAFRYVTWRGSSAKSIKAAVRAAYPGAKLSFGRVFYSVA